MAEKIFGPLKKLPSQIQNLHLFRKAQDVIHKKTKGALYSSQQSLSIGFLEHTTCIAYDEELSLLVVGTRNGNIRMFGQPGVISHVGDLDEEIYHLAFVPHQGKIVSLSGKMHANRITLWSHTAGKWKQENMFTDNELRISSFGFLLEKTAVSAKVDLLIGTETGELRLFSLKDFAFVNTSDESSLFAWVHKFSEQCAINDSPDPDLDKSIVSIEVSANTSKSVLVGLRNGLLAVRHLKEEESDWIILKSAQSGEDAAQLLSAHWICELGVSANTETGSQQSIICSYSSGSYSIIPVESSTIENTNSDSSSVIPYGPFPCSSIGHARAFNISGGGRLVVFSGGVPRSTYADRHTVTVMRLDEQGQTEKVVCFDLFSSVTDIIPLIGRTTDTSAENVTATEKHTEEKTETGETATLQALLILCEEEIVAIDMISDEWLEIRLPYLNSMNFSTVTAVSWIDELGDDVLAALTNRGAEHFSSLQWPVKGGVTKSEESLKSPILVTGHLDGTISLWVLRSGAGISSLGSFSTLSIFDSETLAKYCGGSVNNEENLWPPFCAVGLNRCHPHARAFPADEYRPAISLIEVITPCKGGDQLEMLVATLGGQCSIWKWSSEDSKVQLKPVVADLLSDDLKDLYIWQDKEALTLLSSEDVFYPCNNFQPLRSFAISPPAPILCMDLHVSRKVLSVGTAHGFAVFDVSTSSTIFTKSTLPANPDDLTKQPTQASTLRSSVLGRGKQIRDNLRQSMRRFKNIRLPRSASYSPTAVETNVAKPAAEEDVKDVQSEEEIKEVVEPKDSTIDAPVESENKTEDAPSAVEANIEEQAETVEPTNIDVKDENSPTAEEPIKEAVPAIEEPAPEVAPIEPHPLTGADLSNFSVRAIHLAVTCIVANESSAQCSLILFVGTQRGTIFMYSIEENQSTAASDSAAGEEPPAEVKEHWSVKLIKELQLRHNAPVVGLSVMSAKSHKLLSEEDSAVQASKNQKELNEKADTAPSVNEESAPEAINESNKTPEVAETTEGNVGEREQGTKADVPLLHELLVCSEDQVKIFSLPLLRAKHKHKVANLFPALSSNADQGTPGDTGSLSSSPIPRSPTGTLLASSSGGNNCTLSTSAQTAGRKIRGCSLQWDSQKTQRFLVLLLSNGQFQILNLHGGLRKLLTGQYCSRQCAMSLATAVSVYSNQHRLLLSQPSLGEIICTEYSCEGEQGYATALSGQCGTLQLPELKVEEVPTTTPADVEQQEAPASNVPEAVQAGPDGDGCEKENEHVENKENHENGPSEPLVNGNGEGEKLADITIDSVKEYSKDNTNIICEKKLANEEAHVEPQIVPTA